MKTEENNNEENNQTEEKQTNNKQKSSLKRKLWKNFLEACDDWDWLSEELNMTFSQILANYNARGPLPGFKQINKIKWTIKNNKNKFDDPDDLLNFVDTIERSVQRKRVPDGVDTIFAWCKQNYTHDQLSRQIRDYNPEQEKPYIFQIYDMYLLLTNYKLKDPESKDTRDKIINKVDRYLDQRPYLRDSIKIELERKVFYEKAKNNQNES